MRGKGTQTRLKGKRLVLINPCINICLVCGDLQFRIGLGK